MENKKANRKRTVKIIMLMVVLMLFTVAVSYSVVTIPYTFTSGSTISASQVNYNFSTLGSKMGAMRFVEWGGGQITATGSPYQSLGSTTFTAPATGYVSLKASVFYINNSRSVTTGYNWCYFGIGTSTISVINYALTQTPPGTFVGDTALNVSVDAYQPVTAGTSYTYHVLAWRDTLGTNAWYVSGPTLTIQFYPSLL